VVATTIPLSLLFAVTAMNSFGLSGNLMSLGAIDFGLIVDGAVVLVENIVRRLGEPEGRDKTVRQLTAEAAHEVVRPIAFGVGIIVLVYLPIGVVIAGRTTSRRRRVLPISTIAISIVATLRRQTRGLRIRPWPVLIDIHIAILVRRILIYRAISVIVEVQERGHLIGSI
jgi:multidrug efflux pump subunit AcrB